MKWSFCSEMPSIAATAPRIVAYATTLVRHIVILRFFTVCVTERYSTYEIIVPEKTKALPLFHDFQITKSSTNFVLRNVSNFIYTQGKRKRSFFHWKYEDVHLFSVVLYHISKERVKWKYLRFHQMVQSCEFSWV